MARAQKPRSRRTARGKPSWSEDELELLRRCYSTWPPDFSLVESPTRSRGQIHHQAYVRGLTRGRNVGNLYEHVTDTEWAYLAGLIDGEGTVWFGSGVRRTTKEPYRNLSVHVCNTDRPVLDWVADKWPGGSRQQAAPKEGERLKVLYKIVWARRTVIRELLTGMLPYLHIKKEPAEQVLALLAELEG